METTLTVSDIVSHNSMCYINHKLWNRLRRPTHMWHNTKTGGGLVSILPITNIDFDAIRLTKEALLQLGVVLGGTYLFQFNTFYISNILFDLEEEERAILLFERIKTLRGYITSGAKGCNHIIELCEQCDNMRMTRGCDHCAANGCDPSFSDDNPCEKCNWTPN